MEFSKEEKKMILLALETEADIFHAKACSSFFDRGGQKELFEYYNKLNDLINKINS